MTFDGQFPNTYHGDKWRLTLSNLPTLSDMSEMRYFDNYVQSCIIPPYSMGQIISTLPDGVDIRHPEGGMRKNRDLGTLTINFVLSEDMYNYLLLFMWMMQLKYGVIDPAHNDLFRKYSIKRLTLSMLDNQKRTVAEMSFTEALLTNLGSLDLNFGRTDEIIFSTEFSYQEIFYSVKNPMENGITLDDPINITECGTSGVSDTPTLDWTDVN